MRKKIPAIIAFLVAALFFANAVGNVERRQYGEDIQKLNMVSENITRRLSDAFAYAKVMEIVVRRNQDDISERRFMELADLAMRNSPCIDSFMLAPNAVVKYIYPMGNNKAAIGHDLLHDPNRRQATLDVMATDDVLAQGPVNAIQGGVKIFGRKAITVNNKFWGLAIINVDFEKLLQLSGLQSEKLPFEYALASYNPSGKLNYVYGDPEIINHPDSTVKIVMNNVNWYLSARRPRTVQGFFKYFGAYLFLSILVGLVIYQIEKYYLWKLYMSRTDMLTSAVNRTEFKRLVKRRMEGNEEQFALLLIDLDSFKLINDKYGHMAGDKVLVHVADQIRKAIRKTDVLCRLGGDEYMVMLDKVESLKQIAGTVDRLRNLGEEPTTFEGNEMSVGLSIGCAFCPEDGNNFDSLYKVADERMYKEKLQRKKSH